MTLFFPHPDRAGSRRRGAVRSPLEVAHGVVSEPVEEADRLFRHPTGVDREGDARHETHAIGPGTVLRWQRHTEFHTVTLFAQADTTEDGAPSRALDFVLRRARARWAD